MADFVSDMNNLMNSIGNAANSVSRLYQVRTQLESARVQSDLQQLNNDFVMRTKLPVGDPNRVDLNNWRDALEAHQADQDRVLESVKWDSVKGMVKQQMAPLAGNFRLEFADALNQQEIEQAQADFVTLAQRNAQKGDLDALAEMDKRQSEEQIFRPMDYVKMSASWKSNGELAYLNKKNASLPDQSYASILESINSDKKVSDDTKMTALASLRKNREEIEKKFDSDLDDLLDSDIQKGEQVNLGQVRATIESAKNGGYVDKNKIHAAEGKMNAYVNQLVRGGYQALLDSVTSLVAPQDEFTKKNENDAIAVMKDLYDRARAERDAGRDGSGLSYLLTAEGQAMGKKAYDYIRGYRKDPPKDGDGAAKRSAYEDALLNRIEQTYIVAKGPGSDTKNAIATLFSLAGGFPTTGPDGTSEMLTTDSAIIRAQNMAKDFMVKEMGVSKSAASDFLGKNGILDYSYSILNSPENKNSGLVKLLEKHIGKKSLSPEESSNLQNLIYDLTTAYTSVAAGKNVTPAEVSRQVVPAMMAIYETYGVQFTNDILFGSTARNKAADMFSKIEGVGSQAEILGISETAQVIAPTGGSKRLAQLDREVVNAVKEFVPGTSDESIKINTDNNDKKVLINGKEYELNTTMVEGKREFVLQEKSKKQIVGSKWIDIPGNVIPLYKVKKSSGVSAKEVMEEESEKRAEYAKSLGKNSVSDAEWYNYLASKRND